MPMHGKDDDEGHSLVAQALDDRNVIDPEQAGLVGSMPVGHRHRAEYNTGCTGCDAMYNNPRPRTCR